MSEHPRRKQGTPTFIEEKDLEKGASDPAHHLSIPLAQTKFDAIIGWPMTDLQWLLRSLIWRFCFRWLPTSSLHEGFWLSLSSSLSLFLYLFLKGYFCLGRFYEGLVCPWFERWFLCRLGLYHHIQLASFPRLLSRIGGSSYPGPIVIHSVFSAARTGVEPFWTVVGTRDTQST